MKLEFACRVDIGSRESNDDRVLVLNQIVDESALSGECCTPTMAVVCDGCGGYAGGGIAAETVLSVLLKEELKELTEPDKLSEVLKTAGKEIYKKKSIHPRFARMCTTVAGCVFGDETTLIFHAGDSRVYRYDGSSLARMTVDHSLVQSLIDMGHLSEEEALSSPEKNIITRCLGTDCLPPEIYVSRTPIAPGEIFLICSDGLWESVGDRSIKELLSGNLSLSALADRLVDLGQEQGGHDNISVCLCARPGAPEKPEDKPFVLD